MPFGDNWSWFRVLYKEQVSLNGGCVAKEIFS